MQTRNSTILDIGKKCAIRLSRSEPICGEDKNENRAIGIKPDCVDAFQPAASVAVHNVHETRGGGGDEAPRRAAFH